jgi:hypothetical protein
VSRAAKCGLAAIVRAAALGAAALGIGCAATPPPTVVGAIDAASTARSPVTAPLAAHLVAPAAAPTPSDLAAASLVQKAADVATQHDAGARRLPMMPSSFRVADLPALDPPPILDGARAPVVAGGIEATELVVDWHATGKGPDRLDVPTAVRVGLVTSTWARLKIGALDAAIAPDSVGGVFLTCGGAQSIPQKLLPARWESVTITPEHVVVYHVTSAWFDPRTCSAHVMERRAVTTAPLAGGLLHAFREPCAGASACDSGELVTLLGPRFDSLATSAIGGNVSSADGALTRITLPVRHGGGSSMVARGSSSKAFPWTRALGINVPTTTIMLGVEIAQGVDDPEPIAIAYLIAPDLEPASPSATSTRD